jgi:nucleotide-binding universal stress UspA family protein
MSLEEKMNFFEPGPQLIFRNVSELDPAPATEMQPSTRREAVILSLPQRVPLAAEIAKALGIPPDVFVVQALGVCGLRESAIIGLLKQLEESHPDLRVLEINKRTRIGKWLNGSVTEALFQRAGWPVLVLGPHSFETDILQIGVRNVLCATDRSAASVHALQYASRVAKDHEAKLFVLQVESESGEGATCEYDVALEGLRDWLRGQAVGQEERASRRIGCVVRFGQPEQKILETAAELRCDMIIMGARGLGANPHKPGHFVGGTAYEVACSSYCPVLVVPEPVKTGEGSSIRITSGMMQTAPQTTGVRVSRR